MTHQEGLSQWTATVSTYLPCLSQPQATVLALWSYGMTFVHSCSRNAVALFLSFLLGQKENTIRQRLREWCYAQEDKKGTQRQEIEITTCFAPLLAWVLHLWASSSLALVLDATTLEARFVVLTVSVVYRGCAMPVAWCVLAAQEKGSWQQVWVGLLRLLRPAVPASITVLVLADRGLYARWLFQEIVALHWHPFLRINQGAKFRPVGGSDWYWLNHLVPHQGTPWQGRGHAFISRQSRLFCTLLARWEVGQEEAWFILTDLPARACDAAWYALRAWIEQGFKCIKSAGWQWQATHTTDPDRAARLWLALAVATLWCLSVGSALEDIQEPSDTLEPPGLWVNKVPLRRPVRLLRLGLFWLLAEALQGHPLTMPQPLIPEPWPAISCQSLPVSPLPLDDT